MANRDDSVGDTSVNEEQRLRLIVFGMQEQLGTLINDGVPKIAAAMNSLQEFDVRHMQAFLAVKESLDKLVGRVERIEKDLDELKYGHARKQNEQRGKFKGRNAGI